MRRSWWVLLALAAPAAHAEPWLCTLPDGRKEFSYEAESATQRNCVDYPISRGYVRRAPPPSPYASTDDDFPRIDSKTQKKRDVVRRELLQRELSEERKALAGVMSELAQIKQARVSGSAPTLVREYEQRIRTHRTNIANLEKELALEG